MTLNDLPADLPQGRLIVPNRPWSGDDRWAGGPVCWVSDKPVGDVPGVWRRLQAAREVTGLRPVVLEYVDLELLPEQPGDIDAVDGESFLHDAWAGYRAGLEREASMPVSYDDVPEWVEVPDDPGPSYAAWPGLAQAGLLRGDPELMASEVTAEHPWFRSSHIGLVPAARSADIPALMGWYVEGPRPAEISAVLRSWEDRFGTRVIGARSGGWIVSVAAPPITRAHAEHVALEHLLLCPDTVYQLAATTFPEYVETIIGSRAWTLWWD